MSASIERWVSDSFQLSLPSAPCDLCAMADSTPGYQRFLAELKRRRVFRVMAVYGIVGFVVLQVVDLAVPALLLPDWTYRFVAVVLLAGFPVAVVLAWAFEQTPGGLKRTERADQTEIDEIVAAPAHQRWPAGLLALAGVALLVGGWWIGQRNGAQADAASADSGPADVSLALAVESRDTLPSIAVLPFADMSPEGDQEYFSDGITEELFNTLAKIHELKVLGRTSAFAYRGENKDLRVIGAELGAAYLVQGSVRKAGETLRITAQLIDASDGSHLWSEQYDRPMQDIFAIQTEIAEAIAEELRVPLGLKEGERLVSPTEDLEAYDLYLAGRARMRERGEGIQQAIELFEGAIARDSNWAPAWAGLAESRALVPYYARTTVDSTLWAESLDGAERAARRALELDPKNASALVALGNVHRDRWEWEEAEAVYLRALTLDPENVEAHQQYGEFLAYVGRLDEAHASARRALALDRAPIRLNFAGIAATLNDRTDEGIDFLTEAVRTAGDPSSRWLYASNRRAAYISAGDWAAYRTALVEDLAERQVYTGSERIGTLIREIEEAWPDEAPLSPDIAEFITEKWNHATGAVMFLALGDRGRALEALEFHLDRPHDFGTRSFLFRPVYDPLRDDPRFKAILARNGLEGRSPVRLEDAGPTD